ncbi:uncharacterized protein BO87DRAFT_236441 [Aspergillus neoniger CBS 115656]|uniref:Uncharacterized protein n=1 Tax=Aspergillus neoniger (strain CBS 115656) TaxID=1448310 RepID=A0A318YPR3_ASPNB|nr:hypothetical protein BO87DRAFT_236441 [Aspergillus neoniger CBS 115656]PYH36286.1 hypothetical protein BO87DRAFT_236441 [Aspergillus neoniger CBS 115656]
MAPFGSARSQRNFPSSLQVIRYFLQKHGAHRSLPTYVLDRSTDSLFLLYSIYCSFALSQWSLLSYFLIFCDLLPDFSCGPTSQFQKYKHRVSMHAAEIRDPPQPIPSKPQSIGNVTIDSTMVVKWSKDKAKQVGAT